MTVTIENVGGIKRKATVVIANDQVKEAYNKKLVEVSKQAKIDGFRKGKVPVQLIQQKYGKGIREEVATDLVSNELNEYVKAEKMPIAGQAALLEHNVAKDTDASFVFEFEVYPEIEVASFKGVEIEAPVCEVQDSDVDTMLQNLSKQFSTWKEVQRASKEGDKLVMDFEGFVDGEAFAGGKAEGFELDLGAGNMIPGFEDGLTGVKAGDEKDLEVTFPEQYHEESLAGKPAVFKCKIHAVKEMELPELNDELAAKFEVKDGIEALKNQVRTNMQSQVVQALEQKTKSAVLDKLVEINEVELPQALVTAEIDFLKKDMQQRMQQQFGGKQELPDFDLPNDMFMEQAQKRVKTGLLVAEIIEKDELKPDQAKLDAYLQNMSVSYDDPKEFINWCKSDKNFMARAESYVMEQQVVDKLVLDAKLDSKTYTYQELIDSLNG